MKFREAPYLQFCFALSLAGTIVLNGPAYAHGRQGSGDRIGFVVRGHLYTQSASGGSVRPATSLEKKKWLRAVDRAAVSAVSPDGKYRAVRANQTEVDAPRFQIVRSDGVVVLSPGRIPDIGDGRNVIFDGWLPDSHHIAIWSGSHIAGQDEQHRYIMDVLTLKKLRFDGWLAPSRRAAIVPDQESTSIILDERADYIPGHGYSIHHTGPRYYTAAIPPSLAAYRFSTARRKRLRCVGGSLRTLCSVGEAFDPLNHKRSVEFSDDSRWAVCHGDYDSRGGACYVVSIYTGLARKSQGTDVHFLD